MDQEISLVIAFGGGLLSFLSPCVLPLVPVYLANLAGASALGTDSGGHLRTSFFHSLSFVLGFSLVFITLGTAAGLVGSVVGYYQNILHRVAGGLLIAFGLFLLAALKIPWLNYEAHINYKTRTNPSYLRSLLIGSAFSLGWTPCIGPILGGILTLAGSSQTGWQGAYLLAAYSLGLGTPFLAIGLALGPITPWLRQINRHLNLVSWISGLLLIAVGLLVLTNSMGWLLSQL